MGKEALKLSALAIITYLAVAYGTNFGSDITASTNGGAGIIKAFQGR